MPRELHAGLCHAFLILKYFFNHLIVTPLVNIITVSRMTVNYELQNYKNNDDDLKVVNICTKIRE